MLTYIKYCIKNTFADEAVWWRKSKENYTNEELRTIEENEWETIKPQITELWKERYAKYIGKLDKLFAQEWQQVHENTNSELLKLRLALRIETIDKDFNDKLEQDEIYVLEYRRNIYEEIVSKFWEKVLDKLQPMPIDLLELIYDNIDSATMANINNISYISEKANRREVISGTEYDSSHECYRWIKALREIWVSTKVLLEKVGSDDYLNLTEGQLLGIEGFVELKLSPQEILDFIFSEKYKQLNFSQISWILKLSKIDWTTLEQALEIVENPKFKELGSENTYWISILKDMWLNLNKVRTIIFSDHYISFSWDHIRLIETISKLNSTTDEILNFIFSEKFKQLNKLQASWISVLSEINWTTLEQALDIVEDPNFKKLSYDDKGRYWDGTINWIYVLKDMGLNLEGIKTIIFSDYYIEFSWYHIELMQKLSDFLENWEDIKNTICLVKKEKDYNDVYKELDLIKALINEKNKAEAKEILISYIKYVTWNMTTREKWDFSRKYPWIFNKLLHEHNDTH